MAEFSIVTVCLNSAVTIRDTLRSVADQTDVTVEHIIKDAGSNDDTVLIAAKLNPLARVFVSADRGIYDGMNQGFAEASGEFVGFLNSDDYYAQPDVLAAVRDTFVSTGCDAVYGDIAMVDSKGRVVRLWKTGQLASGHLGGKQLPHPAWFVRRSILAELGLPFDPGYQISADYKQQLLLVEKRCLHIVYVEKTLSVMRMNGASTGSLRAIIRGWRECARAYREVHNRSGWLMVMRKVFSKCEQVWAAQFFPSRSGT